MTSSPQYRERPIQFGRQGSLLGIRTDPLQIPTGVPIVILGAGILPRMGPSRVSVHLARDLAAAGHPVLRFDISGIGDSAPGGGASLESMVLEDIRAAVDHMMEPMDSRGPVGREVVLVGYCSGADNAFYYAVGDPRVSGIVMFDPTIHETAGFRRRELRRRLLSWETWWNVVSGRSLLLRLRKIIAGGPVEPPPDYYGLLVSSAHDGDERALNLAGRGTHIMFVLSRGVHHYCNSPEQVRESLPRGFSDDRFTVVWAPHVDHVFSEVAHQEWFASTLKAWLPFDGFGADAERTRPGPDGESAGRPPRPSSLPNDTTPGASIFVP